MLDADKNMLQSFYWLNPIWVLSAILLPIYALTYFFDYTIANTYSYINSQYYIFGFVLLLCIGIGVAMALMLNAGDAGPAARVDAAAVAGPFLAEPQTVLRIRRFFFIFTTLAILGYLVWFLDVLVHPELLLNILLGESSNIRGEVSTIPGITTLTQFGVPAVIAFMLLYISGTKMKIEKYLLAFLLLLTVMRVILWSERLALIELLLPAGLLFVHALKPEQRLAKKILRIAPVVGLLFLIAFFATCEYFRSWSAAYSQQYQSFTQFILSRMISYYATSVNNGVGFLSTNETWPYFNGQLLLGFAYKMPILKDMLQQANMVNEFDYFLENYANVEFNNPCGLFIAVAELGVLGSLIFFTGYGFLLGKYYRLFMAGDFVALIFYPLMFLSLLELFRIFYFSDARAVYVMVGCLGLTLFAKKKRPAVAGEGNGA
jgi:oligosaccharide repeat unit polymerase